MELEIKHVGFYLPYGLKAINTHRGFIVDIFGIQLDLDIIHNLGKTPIRFINPILRPLSDITKEIEHNGERFVPYEKLGKRPNLLDYKIEEIDFKRLPYELIEKLLEWHFDIFNLIPNNLAIDINTIKQ